MNRWRILSMGKAFTAVEWASKPIQRAFHACVTPLKWTIRRRFIDVTPMESSKVAYYTPMIFIYVVLFSSTCICSTCIGSACIGNTSKALGILATHVLAARVFLARVSAAQLLAAHPLATHVLTAHVLSGHVLAALACDKQSYNF